MIKTTQTCMRSEIKMGLAFDLNNCDEALLRDIESKGYRVVAVSSGVYGINAGELECEGVRYAVVGRGTTLFRFF